MELDPGKNVWRTKNHWEIKAAKRMYLKDIILETSVQPEIRARMLHHIGIDLASEPTDVIIQDKLPETATDESLD
jgi:hypothetical protein